MSEDSPRDDTESIHFTSDLTPHIDQAPKQIGPYKILSELGDGGMGIVYLAEQTKPIHRRVALKVIKPGMDTKQVVARFETEREALALMNHPNVARVFDAGASEHGRPYFVMEYVAGIPITDYCDKHRLNTEERLRLFMDVCNAVQHAHQKGIIHRDIKPNNVLVTVQEGTPTPKVIDFGIAKATQHQLTKKTIFTEQGQLIGTPGYMSPEQAEMSALDIDTRTDVYSLGVLLYELLVGALPFDTDYLLGGGFAEIQRIIREVDPPKPSTRLSALNDPHIPDNSGSSESLKVEPCGGSRAAVGSRAKGRASLAAIAHQRHTEPRALIRKIRGDLDWIVMRCLEKDRVRRYDTANALAMEIGRYLKSEPVLAGPPSALYRLRKLAARNKGNTYTLLLVVFVLIGATAFGTYSFLQTQKALSRAVIAERKHRSERDRATQAAVAAETAQKSEAQHLLWARENEARATMEAEFAHQERERAERATLQNRRVAYDLQIALAQRAHGEGNTSKLFKLLNACPADLRGWEWHHLRAQGPQFEINLNHAGLIRQIGFSDDGRYLYACDNDGVSFLIDTTSRTSFELATEGALAATMHPDGSFFVVGSDDHSIACWDLASRRLAKHLMGHTYPVTSVAFSPDGLRFASGDSEGNLIIWDARLEIPEIIAQCDGGSIESIMFGNDGAIRCGTSRGKVTILDATTGTQITSVETSDAREGIKMAFAKQGRTCVSADWSRIRSIDLTNVLESQDFPISEPIRNIAANAIGDRLAIVDGSGHLNLVDVVTGLETLDLSGESPATAVAFSYDGRRVAAAIGDGLRIWDSPRPVGVGIDMTAPVVDTRTEDQRCRTAIERGLEWLSAQQATDGSFGGLSHFGPNVGITSLAGLAFLSDGSDLDSGQYTSEVSGCLSFIMSNATESGLINSADTSSGPMYGHSFAVLFLAAIQKRNPRSDVADALQRAVVLIEQSQNKEGGWRYQPSSIDADVSVTSCQVVALKAAANVGFPSDKNTLERARNFIRGCQNPDAGFRYLPDSGGSALARTAAALAALLYLGEGGQHVNRGLDFVARWDPSGVQIGHYAYFHYYAAQAMWLAGGDRWGAWWPRVRTALMANQEENGSWSGSAGAEYGTATSLIVLQFPSGTLPQLPARAEP